MPPQKTQPAQVITDGDRLAVIQGMLEHATQELHFQNETLDKIANVMVKLDRLADEAAPLLESPVAKFMAQRRALKHKAAPGGQ